MEEEVCESDQGNPSDQADKMEEEVRESDQESLSDQKDMEEEVPESDQEKEFTPEAMLESVENISIVDGDHKTKLLENKRKEESKYVSEGNSQNPVDEDTTKLSESKHKKERKYISIGNSKNRIDKDKMKLSEKKRKEGSKYVSTRNSQNCVEEDKTKVSEKKCKEGSKYVSTRSSQNRVNKDKRKLSKNVHKEESKCVSTGNSPSRVLGKTPRYAPPWKRNLIRSKHIASQGQVSQKEMKTVEVPKVVKRKVDSESDLDWSEGEDLDSAFTKRRYPKNKHSATSLKKENFGIDSETSGNETEDEKGSEENCEITSVSTSKNSTTFDDNELEKETSETRTLKISVSSVKKSSTRKRVYDSRNHCIFCGKSESKIGRHLLSVHKTEMEVQRILSLKKLTKERKRLMEVLRERGNFYHNLKVSKTGGQIKVARRPSHDNVDPTLYLPCIYCYKYVAKKELWRHKQTCAAEPDTISHKKLQFESSLLIHPCDDTVPDAFKKAILKGMRVDEVSNIIKKDKSILRYGIFLFESQGSCKKAYLSQKLRIIGRLLKELCRINGKDEPLSHFLRPGTFDQCLMATKALSNYSVGNEDAPEMQTPSLALKIGHALTNVAGLERGAAARVKDKSTVDDLRSFIDLIETEWSTRISKVALNTMAENNYNKIELLPLTADLVKLRTEVKGSIHSLVGKLRHHTTVQTWRELAENTQVGATVFNRRRVSEISKITQ